MELIDKAAVVAEIKKLYKEDYKFLPSDIAESVIDFKDDLLMVLDTLEVKEIDMSHSFDATVCKVGISHLKDMDADTVAKALEPYKNGDKVKVIIKVQKGE